MSLSESLFSVDEELESMSDSSVESNSQLSVISSNTTSTNFSLLSVKQQEAIDDESLATQESKDLVKFRLFLITILFWTTIGVGLYVWVYFTEEVENEFKELYEDEATNLLDQIESRFLVAFGAIDAFVLALSAQFSDWPFVTVPRFARQAEQLRQLSNAVAITNYHFVENNQRQEWEAYAAANNFWAEDGIHPLLDYNDLSIPKNTTQRTNSSILVSTFSIASANICELRSRLKKKENKTFHSLLSEKNCPSCTASMATISRQ